MKGIYKGFKYISHAFVVKEEEIQIGFPTDVKHVAHIGMDGPSGSAPSWMNEFKAAPEFSSSLGTSTISETVKSTTDFASLSSQGKSLGLIDSDLTKDVPPSDIPKIRKKPRRKKTQSVSSPKASSSPVSRSSRPTKSKLKQKEGEKTLCE